MDVVPALGCGGHDVSACDLLQGEVLCGGQLQVWNVGGASASASDLSGYAYGAFHGSLWSQCGQRAGHRQRLVCAGGAQEGELLEADRRVGHLGTLIEPLVGERLKGGAGC